MRQASDLLYTCLSIHLVVCKQLQIRTNASSNIGEPLKNRQLNPAKMPILSILPHLGMGLTRIVSNPVTSPTSVKSLHSHAVEY
jgi:hypothetical protein